MVRNTILFLLSFLLLGCVTREAPNFQKKEIKKENQEKDIVAYNRLLIQYQKKKIKEWADTNKVALKESSTGLYFQVLHKGNHSHAKTGNKATISYQLSLLDGTPCYSSDSLGLKTFVIGNSHELSGIQEGVTHIGKNGKILLIMPPHLAYGVVGDQNKIPARAIIKAEVTLVDLQ